MSTTTRRASRSIAAIAALALLFAACGNDDDNDTGDNGNGNGAESADASICVGGEFATRPDGLPGLEKAYGFEFPAGDITALDEDSLVYNQVSKGDCTFGSVFATDGRIGSLDLTVLEDDENFFPPFNGSLNVRTDVLEENPDIEALFAPISEALDDDTMIDLNAQVDVDGDDPKDVAQGWLDDNEDLIDEDVDLSDASITVGSKEFTEQLVLGQLTMLILEDAGAKTKDQTGLVGSTTVREALTSGEIDMYWEYLGTAWVTYLGNSEAIPDVDEQYDALKEADAENDITWLKPAPFNNTYAIAMTQENSDDLGITKISEIKDLIG